VYEGYFKNDRRSGKGKMKYGCCQLCMYEGEWKNGNMHGKGKLINHCCFKQSFSYEGDFKNGYADGKGKKIYRKKSYEGDFKNDYYDGEGQMKYSDGKIYEGQWKDGKIHGIGQMKYSDEKKYNGEWKNGRHDGYGKMLYLFGVIYEGEWKSGIHHGKGKMTVARGIFEGEYYKGNCVRGIMNYENLDVVHIFGPDLVYGKKYSRGVGVYENGDEYEGSFCVLPYVCGFIKEGTGCMTYSNGDKYIGDWVNQCKEGHGKYMYANGDIYEGQWKRGNKFGIGKYTYTDGRILEGRFSRCMYNNHDTKKYVVVEDNENYTRKTMEDITYNGDLNENFNNKKIKKFSVYFDKLNKKKYFQILYCNKLVFSLEIHSNHSDDDIFMIIKNIDCLELCNKNEITEDELDKIYCPISMDLMINSITLSCGHTFDEKNINKLIFENSYEKQYCPLCRQEITNYYVNEEINNILRKCKFQYNGVAIEPEFLQLLNKTNVTNLLNFRKINHNAWLNDIVPN
jgi:hypothetical protein